MKKYAVSYMNFYDNNLMLTIVEAESPILAYLVCEPLNKEWVEQFGDATLDELMQNAFDSDFLFNVVEIKE